MLGWEDDMFKKLLNFVSTYRLVVTICLILTAIPLFWFKPGYIDIGGDSSRLYFYDPLNFLKSFGLNLFLPDSLGVINGGLYLIPYTTLLVVLKFILHSSYLVNTLVNSLSVVLIFLTSFVFVYDFLQLVFHKEKKNIYYSSTLAGLFYVFIPLSSFAGWDLPLILFSERFVYPLIFWLLLRYMYTSKVKYLLFAVGASFLFSQNFSWVALPNVLSFFSVSFLFLLILAVYIKKIKWNIWQLIGILLLFFSLQAFQYVPLLFSFFQKNTAITHQLAQGSNINDIINYVAANANYTERGFALFGLTPYADFSLINLSLLFFPLIIVFMLFKNKKILPLIITLFFLVLFFIVTGKITNTGFEIFKLFFHLPGFVMFRNFYGKWIAIFLFFYTLLVGLAVFTAFIYLRKKYQKLSFSIFFIFILVLNSLPFIRGDISNRVFTKDTGVEVKSRIVVDSQFEKILSYYRNSIYSDRNLSFPFTDFDYQIVPGKNNDGAYLGPSMLAYLTNKTDIGSSAMLQPFSESLYNAAKEKDFSTFSNIFPLLNIRTVFYDSNKYIYDVFATSPYNEAREFLPKTQKEYASFILQLPITKRSDFGENYHIYTVNSSHYLPSIYVATKVVHFASENSGLEQTNHNDASYVLKNFILGENDTDLRKAFLDDKVEIGSYTAPIIAFSRISSSKYAIHITNATAPYLLVFLQAFNPNWKIYLADEFRDKQAKNKKVIESYFQNTIQEKENNNTFLDLRIFENIGKNPIAENRHYLVNAYANAWYILPADIKNKSEYTLIIEMTDQRVVYVGLMISGLALIIYLIWLAKELVLSMI